MLPSVCVQGLSMLRRLEENVSVARIRQQNVSLLPTHASNQQAITSECDFPTHVQLPSRL